MNDWARPAGGPFEKKSINLAGGPVTYHIAGDGPSILYLHSAGGIRFTHALDALSEKFRICMMVSPGFDGTPTHDGVDTMPALAGRAGEVAGEILGEEFDVMGQSFGGFLSAWFAALHGEKVGQLVLQCPSGFRPKQIPRAPAADPEEAQRRMYAHPERIPAGEKTPEQLADGRKWSNYYHKSVGLDEELVSRLGAIECLTLILQGTKDGMMPPESGQLLKREIPSAILMYVYDAGHNIEVDQPERFVDTVGDFLTRGQAFIVNPGQGEEVSARG